ncbi:MAG: hypothetical protein EOP24_42135 [Hyphomicrobiales bacterium]|nr:MAG: hypothetical protein EOP24_42135 [Hyphomicrobiales bacterium]
MIFNERPAESVGNEPVRLIAFGRTGVHFAKTLHERASGPLAHMLSDQPRWREPEDLIETVRSFDFEGLAFLFIVIGSDATDFEVGQAVMLVWQALERGIIAIGFFIQKAHAAERVLTLTGSQWPWQPAVLMNFLMELVDGRVDGLSSESSHDLEAVSWFYGTLRALGREGVLILEPAWDLHDITEVLDLPGARLTLLTRTLEVGELAATAVKEALDDLETQGVELELAGGVLLIVWQGPPHRLTVQQVGVMSRMVRDALGAGGQHLVLTSRALAAPPGTYGIGACATLVVSRGWRHDALKDWP